MRTILATLLPLELLPLLIIAGGLALVVGARRWARSLFAFAAMMLVLPIILDPLIDALPWWLLLPLVASAAFALLGAVASFIVGPRAAPHLIALLTADVIRWAWLTPFRLLRWLLIR